MIQDMEMDRIFATVLMFEFLLDRFEDAIDAFTMIFNGGQYWLLGWTIGNMFSISIFNYSGYSFVSYTTSNR